MARNKSIEAVKVSSKKRRAIKRRKRYLEKQAKPSELENREETLQKPCEVGSPKTATTEEKNLSKPGERPENKYNREIKEFWDDFKHDPLFANMVKFKVKKRHLKNFKKNINKDKFWGL